MILVLSGSYDNCRRARVEAINHSSYPRVLDLEQLTGSKYRLLLTPRWTLYILGVSRIPYQNWPRMNAHSPFAPKVKVQCSRHYRPAHFLDVLQQIPRTVRLFCLKCCSRERPPEKWWTPSYWCRPTYSFYFHVHVHHMITERRSHPIVSGERAVQFCFGLRRSIISDDNRGTPSSEWCAARA